MASVRPTVVADEIEAEVLCGSLRSSGIECDFRKTDRASAIGTYSGGWAMAGPVEVLVDERNLVDARQLIGPR